MSRETILYVYKGMLLGTQGWTSTDYCGDNYFQTFLIKEEESLKSMTTVFKNLE